MQYGLSSSLHQQRDQKCDIRSYVPRRPVPSLEQRLFLLTPENVASSQPSSHDLAMLKRIHGFRCLSFRLIVGLVSKACLLLASTALITSLWWHASSLALRLAIDQLSCFLQRSNQGDHYFLSWQPVQDTTQTRVSRHETAKRVLYNN